MVCSEVRPYCGEVWRWLGLKHKANGRAMKEQTILDHWYANQMQTSHIYTQYSVILSTPMRDVVLQSSPSFSMASRKPDFNSPAEDSYIEHYVGYEDRATGKHL